MMKYFLTIIFLAISLNSYSQQQIEGFWNIKLGEKESTVIASVKKQYPNAKFDEDIVGKPFRVRNPYLAGIEMNVCEFSFSNNVFVKAEFSKGTGRVVPEYERQSFISTTEQEILPYYSQLVELMSSKYGTPITSINSALWRTSNGNTITVKLVSSTQREDFLIGKGKVYIYYGMSVIYSTGTHINDF